MPIRITGLDRTLRAMGKSRAKTGKTVDEALKRCAEILLAASQKLVPRDTEALAISGRVEGNGKTGLAAAYSVAYGNEAVDYAFVVHERLDVTHAPPTQARYLSDAVPKVRGTMTSVLRRTLSVK